MFLLKIPTLKKFSPGGMLHSPYGEGKVLPPVCTKIICDFTIAITNKYFKFQNDWLKLIPVGTIARNFVLYHCVKEIKKFE